MRRHLAALVALSILVGGCASFQLAVDKTQERFSEALTDPVRRLHVFEQASSTLETAGVAIGCMVLVPVPFNFIVCPMVALVYNFVVYEYVAEPVSKDRVKHGLPSVVGPYWERGPQDGEEFICEGVHGGRWDHGQCVDQVL